MAGSLAAYKRQGADILPCICQLEVERDRLGLLQAFETSKPTPQWCLYIYIYIQKTYAYTTSTKTFFLSKMMIMSEYTYKMKAKTYSLKKKLDWFFTSYLRLGDTVSGMVNVFVFFHNARIYWINETFKVELRFIWDLWDKQVWGCYVWVIMGCVCESKLAS